MIILASKSPRRKQLLSMMGLEFTVQTADIDETMDPSQTPAHEVAAVSARKAEKIAALHPQDVIVSADTIVVIDGKILGKPKDEQDAARMLRLLSGRTHTVYTGLTVHANGKANTQVVSTGVTFRDLSNAEIAAYIETKEPMDKAGAYGIQGYGSMFVSHLDGDYFCVMGLPVCTLAWMLRDAGVDAPRCGRAHSGASLTIRAPAYGAGK